MLPYRDSRITIIVLSVFFLLALGYAYFEAQSALYGPRIAISDGVTVVEKQFIVIRGQAENISVLRMNGRDIAVTEDGSFDEPYVLAPGYNRIILEAEDKYGRRRESVLEIIYKTDAEMPENDSTSAVAPIT